MKLTLSNKIETFSYFCKFAINDIEQRHVYEHDYIKQYKCNTILDTKYKIYQLIYTLMQEFVHPNKQITIGS